MACKEGDASCVVKLLLPKTTYHVLHFFYEMSETHKEHWILDAWLQDQLVLATNH